MFKGIIDPLDNIRPTPETSHYSVNYSVTQSKWYFLSNMKYCVSSGKSVSFSCRQSSRTGTERGRESSKVSAWNASWDAMQMNRGQIIMTVIAFCSRLSQWLWSVNHKWQIRVSGMLSTSMGSLPYSDGNSLQALAAHTKTLVSQRQQVLHTVAGFLSNSFTYCKHIHENLAKRN